MSNYDLKSVSSKHEVLNTTQYCGGRPTANMYLQQFTRFLVAKTERRGHKAFLDRVDTAAKQMIARAVIGEESQEEMKEFTRSAILLSHLRDYYARESSTSAKRLSEVSRTRVCKFAECSKLQAVLLVFEEITPPQNSCMHERFVGYKNNGPRQQIFKIWENSHIQGLWTTSISASNSDDSEEEYTTKHDEL